MQSINLHAPTETLLKYQAQTERLLQYRAPVQCIIDGTLDPQGLPIVLASYGLDFRQDYNSQYINIIF